MNGAALLLSACDRVGPEFRRNAEELRLSYEMMVSRYFDPAPEGTLFVFGGQYDCPGPHRYRHKRHGWEIKIEPNGLENLNAADISTEELEQELDKLRSNPKLYDNVAAVSRHIHRHYESVSSPEPPELDAIMTSLIDRIPVGSKLVVVLDHDQFRDHDGKLKPAAWISFYGKELRKIVEPYTSFVGVASFSDHIRKDDEIHGGSNHFERAVYHRMAQGIVKTARRLHPRATITARTDRAVA